jgi:ketosteroid isomerase-like protein
MGDVYEERNVVEEELRQVVLERVTAVHSKDSETLASRQAQDVVVFDVLPPLYSHGSEAVEGKTQAWFDSYSGEIGYEVRELHIATDGDVGFCSFVYHVSGTLVASSEVDMWVRATLGCRRIEGEWLTTHDHGSVPFDPASGQALIDLRP